MKKALGNRGEEIAVRYLKGKGYRILHRNFRTPIGEIDIIAEDRDRLVFLEVKTRADDSFGHPFEAVDQRKRERMKKVALYYMKNSGIERPVRFDVISIEIKGNESSLSHIIEAF